MNESIDRAGPIRAGEELDTDRLQQYLFDHLPHSKGPLIIEQFPSGHSNLTYLINLGGKEYVLRRPPFGNQVKTAHDMGREYRVLSKLCEVYPPAPRPYLYCRDAAVLGDEFYVMERRHGVVLRGPMAPQPLQSNPDTVRQLCEAFIDNLARLHTIDLQAAGLEDFGKPEGYVERQVSGWTKRYTAAKTQELPEIDRLAEWLEANRPADSRPALIHNDYKYDNLLLDPEDLTRIVAVLDWEMATVGDPLMDLGSTLAYWVEKGDAASRQNQAFGPTMLPGSLNRHELAARYAEQTGFQVTDMLFYYCFGLFKLAVIVQQIYARYARGHTQDPRFAQLHLMVAALAKAAVQAIDAGEI